MSFYGSFCFFWLIGFANYLKGLGVVVVACGRSEVKQLQLPTWSWELSPKSKLNPRCKGHYRIVIDIIALDWCMCVCVGVSGLCVCVCVWGQAFPFGMIFFEYFFLVIFRSFFVGVAIRRIIFKGESWVCSIISWVNWFMLRMYAALVFFFSLLNDR